MDLDVILNVAIGLAVGLIVFKVIKKAFYFVLMEGIINSKEGKKQAETVR